MEEQEDVREEFDELEEEVRSDPELDWQVWTHPDGDSFSRYWVRLQETREATYMVEQLLDRHRNRPRAATITSWSQRSSRLALC